MGWALLGHPFMVTSELQSPPPPPPLQQYKKRCGGISDHIAAGFQAAAHPQPSLLALETDSSSVFSTMGFRLRPTSSGPGTSPLHHLQVLSLLVLLLTALVPTTVGQCKRNSGKDEGGRPLAFRLWLHSLWCVCGRLEISTKWLYRGFRVWRVWWPRILR